MCLVHQRPPFLRHHLSFNRNIEPEQIPATRHVVLNCPISCLSGREVLFADSPQT
jgi:hypothetical protein